MEQDPVRVRRRVRLRLETQVVQDLNGGRTASTGAAAL